MRTKAKRVLIKIPPLEILNTPPSRFLYFNLRLNLLHFNQDLAKSAARRYGRRLIPRPFVRIRASLRQSSNVLKRQVTRLLFVCRFVGLLFFVVFFQWFSRNFLILLMRPRRSGERSPSRSRGNNNFSMFDFYSVTGNALRTKCRL